MAAFLLASFCTVYDLSAISALDMALSNDLITSVIPIYLVFLIITDRLTYHRE
jgi:hypothetical protein